MHWLFVPGPQEKPVPIAEAPKASSARSSAKKRGPLATAIRVPAFWGLVVAFAGYGLAFSAMSFHLIPLLAERKIEMGVVMAIIALIGPMQVVGRVLLMAAQNRISTIQLGAGIYFAFPISMAMLAAGISDVYGLILFAIIYGVANGLVTILRGMFQMFTGAPIAPGRSRGFFVVGVPKGEGQRLPEVAAMVDRLSAEDAPVLSTMRFRRGLLTASDRHLARYFKYVEEFPTFLPPE